jgi:hypothetical protein
MGAKRPIPRVRIGRLYSPDMETLRRARVGMRSCVRAACPNCVLGYMGDRKASHYGKQWGVPWLACFNRERWQDQRLGVRGESPLRYTGA